MADEITDEEHGEILPDEFFWFGPEGAPEMSQETRKGWLRRHGYSDEQDY